MSEAKEKSINLYRGDTASKEFYIENIDPADFSAISIRLEAKRADNNETVIGFDILDSDSGNDWPNNKLVANFLSAYTQTIKGEGTIILKYDIEVTRVNGSNVQVDSEYFGLILLEADVTVGNPVLPPETTVDIYANLASLDNSKGAGYIGVKSSLWSGIATTVQGALEWLKGNYIQFTGTFSAGKLLKSTGSSAQATVSGISISSDDALSGVKSVSVTDAPSDNAHLTRKGYVDDGLALKEDTANKNAPSGYAGLDVSGKVPSALLPTYVDDVLEFADLASFPVTGESGKIYVAIDTNQDYRWTGSSYLAIVSSPGSTDSLAEGSINLFFTGARAIASLLTGYATSSGTISASDTILQAFQKVGYFIANIAASILNTALTGLSLSSGGAITSSDSVLVAFGKLQNQITNISAGLPVGTIIESARSSAPTDYLECDGSALSRTTFATLFAEIGTTYGAGDGSSTFNIPDRRANVGRGAGTSSGYTENVTIAQGAKTDDALQLHHHQFYGLDNDGGAGSSIQRITLSGNNSSIQTSVSGQNSVREAITDGSHGAIRGESETRVKSLGMKYFIKYQ